MKLARLVGTTVLAVSAMTGSAMAEGETVCLITKTDTNPFFVKMKEGATAKGRRAWNDTEGLCGQN